MRLVSAQDREIFEYARRDGDIVMTKDSDFSNYCIALVRHLKLSGSPAAM